VALNVPEAPNGAAFNACISNVLRVRKLDLTPINYVKVGWEVFFVLEADAKRAAAPHAELIAKVAAKWALSDAEVDAAIDCAYAAITCDCEIFADGPEGYDTSKDYKLAAIELVEAEGNKEF
tara:strand:- start:298 stop:663 length:366 start_codon:yes stop_codon:yes gene_type:complete